MTHDAEIRQAFAALTTEIEEIENGADATAIRHRLTLLLADLEATVGEIETERDQYRQEAMSSEQRVEDLVEVVNGQEGRLEDWQARHHDRERHGGPAALCPDRVCDDVLQFIRHDAPLVLVEP